MAVKRRSARNATTKMLDFVRDSGEPPRNRTENPQIKSCLWSVHGCPYV